MTLFVADTVTHRTRWVWLAAALAASGAAFAATRAAPADEPTVRELGIGRCREAQLRAAQAQIDPFEAHHGLGAAGSLPLACLEYQQRLWHLSECDQLPVEGRRALREAWEQAKTSWSKLPADQRVNLAEGCRMGSAALDEATVAMRCTYYDRDRILIAGPIQP